MINATLTIRTQLGGVLNIPTHRAYNVIAKTNKHGFGSLEFDIDLNASQQMLLYGNTQVLRTQLRSSTTCFDGRLEDYNLNGRTVHFIALGFWRALSDVPYTAMWSVTRFNDFYETQSDNLPAYNQTERWQLDLNDRAFIALVKNNAYTLTKAAGLYYEIPNNSSRQIIGVQFSLEINLPTQATFRCVGYNAGTPFTSGTVHASLVGTGALVTRAYHLSGLGPLDIQGFDVLCNTAFTYAGETAASYAKVTNVRIVTTTANRINTTLTAARAAGTGVTATVGSTARMYAGMQLVINSGNNPSEIITVTSVTNTTQFVATFANSYAIGNAVQGFIVDGSEIIMDLIQATANINASQLIANTSAVQTTGFDLLDEVYEDEYPDKIADYIASLGDGTNAWEVGVLEDQQVYFRLKASAGKTWYIDLQDPEIQTTIDTLYNQAYAVYKDSDNTKLRTPASGATSADTSRYKIIRRAIVQADTTNATLADKYRDTFVNDNSIITPRTAITVRKVWTYPAQTPARLTDVRSGDTIIIKNLPPATIGTTVDRLRTFRVLETSLNVDDGTLTITPEAAIKRLDYLLALAALKK